VGSRDSGQNKKMCQDRNHFVAVNALPGNCTVDLNVNLSAPGMTARQPRRIDGRSDARRSHVRRILHATKDVSRPQVISGELVTRIEQQPACPI
jgi:hypothetical protein